MVFVPGFCPYRQTRHVHHSGSSSPSKHNGFFFKRIKLPLILIKKKIQIRQNTTVFTQRRFACVFSNDKWTRHLPKPFYSTKHDLGM
uniref:Uncharacterized protein n=1 Tax=Setaria italica TaxID=4555 RepID=K3YB81_SETIT